MKLVKVAAALTAVGFLMGNVACGGADKGAKDATDEAAPAEPADEGGGLEKFEGNKMEVADDEAAEEE